MRKALGCAVLSATLAGGAALPAHGLPTTDATTAAAPAQAAAARTPAADAALRPTLRAGSRAPAVVFVQQELAVSPATGYYGTLTEAAVRAWQESRGLRVTGVVDAAAWTQLLGPASKPTVTASAVSPRTAAKARPSLRVGSRTPAVVFVQQKLGISPATGYYGTLTKRAVTRLQKAKGLKATGTVTKATWKVLLSAQGVIATPSTPSAATAPSAPAAPPPAPAPSAPASPPPAPAPPTPEQAAAARPALAQGAGPGDPAVVFVQRHLKVTPTSGYFGPLTRAAVLAYQSGLGLAATGTVDAATWEAILAGRTVSPPAAPPATPPPNPQPSAPAAPPTPAPATIRTPVHALPATPTARDHALVFALAQVGKPYVLGGNGPAVFDCSGLVQQAYLSAGVTLPRLASQQRFAGTTVPIDQLLPGDLLYYQSGSSPRSGHISMYAGNGLVVEAANPRRGVRIRTLHEAWYRDRFVAAVRIG